MRPGLPSIELSFVTPLFLVFLLVIAAGILSFFFYRFTLPAVSTLRRIVLSMLRGVSLALLLFLLCEPLLRLVFVSHHPPVIAVLVDMSASMGIEDKSGHRAAIATRLLHRDVPAALPAGVDARYYPFGARFGPAAMAPPDSLTPGDEVTDIAGALTALARERESTNIRAAVLLTDGVYTIGENPVHDAEILGVPLYTIGVGDTSEQKDILIYRIAANDVVYAGTSIPVDITIKSTGFSGERVGITLSEKGRVLDRSTLNLPSGTAESAVKMTYVPEAAGWHRYTVSVSSLAGELTTANNQRTFPVRVLKSKLHILILAAGPGTDLTVIRQTLAEQKNFSVVTRIQRAGSGFYEATLSEADIDSADCLLTIGMPTTETSAATMNLINNAVNEKKKPVLFIDGMTVDHSRLVRFAPSLPVDASGPPVAEQEVEFVPDPAQRANPLLVPDPVSGLAPWSRLPPLFATQTLYTLREGGNLLGTSRLHNTLIPRPLMATRAVAGMRSLAILGYGVWRWRLMSQGNPETSRLLSDFLNAAVTWLSSRDGGRTVRALPAKDEFSRGERIEFAAQVYNASAQPVENAQVRVTVQGGEQILEADLRSIGSGRYEGTIDGLSQGEYSYRVVAASGGTTLGEDSGSFTVGGLNLEFLNTRMNAEMLRQIAYTSGGKFFTAGTAANLRGALDSMRTLLPREEKRTEAIELPHWPYMFGLLIVLLSAEWIIRKRSGML